MIHDVDECLRALAERDALAGSRVEIAFDAPTREWSARQNAPTVSLYLYDIREDLQRREVSWEAARGDDGLVTEHRSPARRFRLSYMITCWTQRPEDEHRLLSAMLGCFLRHPYVPAEYLVGSLRDSPAPVLMTIALPPPPDRSLADVWSALGGELKPSLDLVVTAAMDSRIRVPAAAPVREGPIMRIGRPGARGDATSGSGGRRGGSGRAGGGKDDGHAATDAADDRVAAAGGVGGAGRRRSLSPADIADIEEVRTAGPRRPAPALSAAAPATAAGGKHATTEPAHAGRKGRGKGAAAEAAAAEAEQADAGAAPLEPLAGEPGRRFVIRSIRRP